MSRKKRPTGVTVAAILEILLGLGNLSLGYMIIAEYDTMTGMIGWIGIFGDLLDAVGFLVGGILMLIAIVHLALAYGFLKEEGWAWILGFILSIVGIFFGIVFIPIGIILIITNATIIYYLNRLHMIEFFRNPL